jgi:hypothetical protein
LETPHYPVGQRCSSASAADRERIEHVIQRAVDRLTKTLQADWPRP